MGIIYVITLFVLFFSMFYLKRSNKKLDMVVWTVYVFGIIYFTTLVFALVLSALNIKNSLLSFSVCNLLLSFFLFVRHRNKYGKVVFQDYYLNKKELAIFLLIIVGCGLFGYFRYSGYGAFNYRISDATVHLKMSNDYTNYMKLFDGGFTDKFYDFKNSMFGFYVPCGIVMEILPFINVVSYNIFNVMFLCLLILTFYVSTVFVKNSDKHNLFVVIITLLYAFAYPFNYSLFGFGYLGPGILAVNLIILTWEFIMKYDKKYFYLILLLFNFGLFVSYFLFAPAVYLSEGLFMIYLFVKEKYDLKGLIKYGLFCLILPTIFGFFYFIYDKYGVSTAISNYSIDGFSYNNFIGNYVLLLPLVIYSMVLEVKKKKIGFDFVFFICEILYIIFTFILVGVGGVSEYYFYKSYFILWVVTNILIFKLINYKEARVYLIISYVLIILAIIFSIFDVEKIVSEKNSHFGYDGTVHQLGDIYSFNLDMIKDDYKVGNSDILLMKSAKDHYKDCVTSKNKIPYLGKYLKRRLFYSMNGIIPALDYKKDDNLDIYTNEINYEKFKDDKSVRCMLVSNDYLKDYKYDINYDDYEILYSNKAGKLIKKK